MGAPQSEPSDGMDGVQMEGGGVDGGEQESEALEY